MTFKKTITMEIDDEKAQYYIDTVLERINNNIAEYESAPEGWKKNSEEFYKEECRRKEMYSNDPSLIIAEALNYRWNEYEPDVMCAFTDYRISETPFES